MMQKGSVSILTFTYLASALIWWSPCQVLASIDGNMSEARRNHARLLDALYAHRALQDGLSPHTQHSTTNLSILVVPYNVFGINEVAQTMESYIIFSVTWADPDLTWVPEDYGGIDTVLVPRDRIWHPTLNIIDAGHQDYQSLLTPSKITLNCQGSVSFTVGNFIKTSCNLDLTDYPFDIQECHVVITQDYSDSQLIQITEAAIVEIPAADENVRLKGNWEVIGKELTLIKNSTGGYDLVDCRLRLKRRQLFYVLCVLVPIIVTASLAAFVFWIPPSSGEKMSFLVSLFLANTVMLNFIGDHMPRSLDTAPRLLVFMLAVMLECSLAVMLTAFVMHRYNIEQREEAMRSNMSDHHCTVNTRDSNMNTNIDLLNNHGVSDQVSGTPTDGIGEVEDLYRRNATTDAKVYPLSPKTARMEQPKKGWRRIKVETWDKIFFAFSCCTLIPIMLWSWL